MAFLRISPEYGKFQAGVSAYICMENNKATQALTLRKAIDNFIIAKKVEGKSPATISFYAENLERFVWWCRHTRVPTLLSDISTDVLREFLHYVQTAVNRWGIGSTSSRHQASKGTLDAYWRTLKAFFSWQVAEEHLTPEQNPMRKIKRTKVDQKIIQDIPAELFQKALALFSGDSLVHVRNRAMLLVFGDTGDRLAEFTNLKVTDLNLANGTARVFGKGGKERTVGLGHMTVEALKVYLATRLNRAGPLWLKADGCPLSYTGIQITIRRLKKLGGNVRWTPHTLRNTFAMNYLRAGGDPFTLQILGGWVDLEMPRHYTAALNAEDALRVHRRASPVNFLLKDTNGNPDPEGPAH